MDNKYFYSVGELSRICDVPISTLHYYDEKDILKPIYIDEDNGYRYYNQDQVLKLFIIKELKYRNLTLAKIKDFFQTNNLSGLKDILVNQKKELEIEIEKLVNFKNRIEIQINSFTKVIELQNKIDLDTNSFIEVIEYPKRYIFSIRKKDIFGFVSVGLKFLELFNLAIKKDVNITHPYFTIFHEDYKNLNIFHCDYEVCAALTNIENDYSKNCVRLLEPSQYVKITVKGSYEKSISGYNSLIDYIKQNNYEIIGPTEKYYLATFAETNNTSDMISEIQIPVKKKL